MKPKWTGERLETFVISNVSFEHLHRYALAKSFAKNRIVLDIACGEGYGANLLAEEAKTVIGIDKDESTIRAAKDKYSKTNLRFETGLATKIPLPDAFFDIVISFETIEHIGEHDEMLKEIKRVLKEDGLFIVSTPDKNYFTNSNPYTNPFHVKELYEKEFDDLLRRHFKNAKLFRQVFTEGSLLTGSDERGFNFFTGNFQKLTSVTPDAKYWIGFACDGELPGVSSSFFYNEKMYDEIVNQEIQAIKRTFTYRFGHLLLSPFKWLRSFFKL
jgi:ubiquinone/menaquinone biosynthesis C-methylase UbiE